MMLGRKQKRTNDPVYYIYTLFDPRILEHPFYIGKGRDYRCYQHASPKANATSAKDKLILEINSLGMRIEVAKLVEDLIEDEAYVIEIELIAALGRYPDGVLLNRSSGGGHASSGMVHTEAHKRFISELRLGQPMPQLRGIRGLHKNKKPRSEAQIAHNHRLRSDVEKANMRGPRQPYGPMSEEHKQAHRDAHAPRSPYIHSEETRAKMRGPRGPQRKMKD